MSSIDNVYIRSAALVFGTSWLYSMNHYMNHGDNEINLFDKWSNLQKNLLLVGTGCGLSGAYCYLFVFDRFKLGNRAICK